MANFVFMGVAMVFAIVQPYKAEFAIYNVVDLVFVLTMALLCSTAFFIIQQQKKLGIFYRDSSNS